MPARKRKRTAARTVAITQETGRRRRRRPANATHLHRAQSRRNPTAETAVAPIPTADPPQARKPDDARTAHEFPSRCASGPLPTPSRHRKKAAYPPPAAGASATHPRPHAERTPHARRTHPRPHATRTPHAPRTHADRTPHAEQAQRYPRLYPASAGLLSPHVAHEWDRDDDLSPVTSLHPTRGRLSSTAQARNNERSSGTTRSPIRSANIPPSIPHRFRRYSAEIPASTPQKNYLKICIR